MMNRPSLVILFTPVLLAIGCSAPVENSPVAQGKAFFAEGKWDAAVEAFSEAIARNPLDAEAFLWRGQAYMCNGREHVGQAIADYNEAIRLDGKNHEAYYLRALAYKERGDTDKAYADEMKARTLDPNVAKIRPARPTPSLETYEKTLELTGELGSPPKEIVAKEEFESFPEREPIPGVKQPEKEQVRENSDKDVDAISSLGKSDEGEVRDAYGLPLSRKPTTSITEQLFGSDAVGIDDDQPVTPRRPMARRRPPAVDWQAQEPSAAPLPPADSAPPARRPSPIGTLPFGNPYQPRANPYSPYGNPYGPRSTGLRGNPLPRESEGDYRGGYSAPGGYPRRDPNAIPREPGAQPPMVDPR